MVGHSIEVAPFMASPAYSFGEFRFEPASGALIRDGVEVHLRPKTAGVLAVLVAHAGEVVAKTDLLDRVWGGMAGDESLTVCVAELRRALHEQPKIAHFIATVYRRGYRFIAPVATMRESAPGDARSPVVRQSELAELDGWWHSASSGVRTVGFIAGEVGAGKTTLVQAFLARFRGTGLAVLGEARCVDLHSTEPYLPLLDAMGALCRGPNGARFRGILSEVAPDWLAQLPGVVDPAAVDRVRRQAIGRSAGRLQREAADALDAMSAVAPVVLVLEDLDAGDRSTIEMISYLAQRSTSARVLVLATYRPDAAGRRRHPLGEVLRSVLARRACRHLELAPLGETGVAAVLASRLAPAVASAGLAAQVFTRTEGNPLFATTLIEWLIAEDALYDDGGGGGLRARGPIARLGIPPGVRRVVSYSIDRFAPEDRELLRVAAVAGLEFTVTEVHAGLSASVSGEARWSSDRLERRLLRIARHSGVILEVEPVWADGTINGCFRFAHSLVRDVLSEQLGGARRARAASDIRQAIDQHIDAATRVGRSYLLAAPGREAGVAR
ncbi:AAA family ATPase [Agromyces humatus]|uniref:OmpR/PhoB-type domain-containing protein n=1 Tax=Agromyces humatus TaxID=279573 RepID=A0ABN2KIU8_9MICO|nr:AAA family ATPase [Agromyces humatus]